MLPLVIAITKFQQQRQARRAAATAPLAVASPVPQLSAPVAQDNGNVTDDAASDDEIELASDDEEVID